MSGQPSNNFSTTINYRKALHALLSVEGTRDTYLKAQDNEHAHLTMHPVGLETVFDTEGWGRSQSIKLVAHPGLTDRSVEAMKCVIRGEMSENYIALFQLRVIRVPINSRYSPSQKGHDLYFEFRSTSGTYICGGCNDCSGAGKAGASELFGIFMLIGLVFEKEVEEVVAEEYDADEVRNALTHMYDTFLWERKSRVGRRF